jgi:hypothetical protein
MDSLSSCAMLFALFSPAVLLGIERGNYELFIFFLLSFVVWQFAKNSTGYYLSGIAMLFLAFVLKLYPLFGLAVIFRRKSLAIVIGAVTLVLVTAYLLIIRNDLPLIYYGTSKSIYMSYGMDVFPSYVAKYYGENSGTTARFFSYAAVASLCLPVIFGYRTGVPAEVPSVGGDQKRADSFWIGSSIYIGTFIFLGGNYDYRLMFLLLTIPQLVSYSRAATRHVRLTARMVLVSIFVSMWYLKINDIIGLNKVFLLFEELCNWLQFYGLAYLLVGSMSASRRISEIISRMDTSSQCHNQSRNMSSVG